MSGGRLAKRFCDPCETNTCVFVCHAGSMLVFMLAGPGQRPLAPVGWTSRRQTEEASEMARRKPGEVRDAIIGYLRARKDPASVGDIHAAVEKRLGGEVARSSVRSYLGLNEGSEFERVARGRYRLRRGR